MTSIKATVQRRVTDEEFVTFEGTYDSDADARWAVTAQLDLCRTHMIALNERVRAVHETKSTELEARLASQGDALATLNRQLADATDQLAKTTKRLRSA